MKCQYLDTEKLKAENNFKTINKIKINEEVFKIVPYEKIDIGQNIGQKLDIITEYLNDQKILMELILEKLNIERKNTDYLENRISNLENKVIEAEVNIEDSILSIEEKINKNVSTMRVNEEGDLLWLNQEKWEPLEMPLMKD